MRLSHDTTIIEHLDRASARVSRAAIKTICYRGETRFSADVSNLKSRVELDLSNLGVLMHKHGGKQIRCNLSRGFCGV